MELKSSFVFFFPFSSLGEKVPHYEKVVARDESQRSGAVAKDLRQRWSRRLLRARYSSTAAQASATPAHVARCQRVDARRRRDRTNHHISLKQNNDIYIYNSITYQEIVLVFPPPENVATANSLYVVPCIDIPSPLPVLLVSYRQASSLYEHCFLFLVP